MKSGVANLGGIGYRLDVHEGMATFVERDRMSCARITVQKCSPHGLLYVQVSSATGFVPYSHIQRATSLCESLFGPNHYTSLREKHRNERNIAMRNIFRRPIFKPNQRLFWSHEVRFRFASVWRAVGHAFQLVCPARQPHVEWEAVA